MTLPPDMHAGELRLEPGRYKTRHAAYKAEHGVLAVPENRLQPGSRLIALPVKRIHSQSTSPLEPVFYLGGGPGLSNMRFKPQDELLKEHDVVLVGYRGVDGSTRLDAPEYSRATLGDGFRVLSDASLAIMAEAVRTFQRRVKAAGVDLSGYTMQQVVEDLEAVRVSLGYQKINLLSESYGTRVAQVYAAAHPDSLKRSVMLGVNPPGRFVWEPAMVDRQIEAYSQLWGMDADARSRSGDLANTMRKVSQHMPPRWLFFSIDPGKVNTVAFVMFFNRRTSALVFDAFVAAEGGDASGLALMSLAYDLMVPNSFVWGDFFAKGASADLDLNRDYTSELRAPGSIIGSPVALMVWSALSKAWKQNGLPFAPRAARASAVETLLVSGSLDFSTPAQYATDELLPSLTHGKQVVLAEIGHVADLWGVQPAATMRLLSSFFDTGRADDSLYQYEPMDFKVRFGFPALAKLLLGSGVLPVLGAALGIKRLMRNALRSTASITIVQEGE